ncbi:hypothetical protein LCGC14_1022630 [marine sediment metagenome]|uniref:Uncharacterized protein n=1 Tax=marine sediment metagenome TaxID=412755 RepID=A0A0F9MX35_9ZZZZ
MPDTEHQHDEVPDGERVVIVGYQFADNGQEIRFCECGQHAIKYAGGWQWYSGIADTPKLNMRRTDDLTIFLFLMIRQISGLVDCQRHIITDEVSDVEFEGYKAFMKTELADMTVMVRHFCRALDLDEAAVSELGWQRDEEKRIAWQRRHPGRRWR